MANSKLKWQPIQWWNNECTVTLWGKNTYEVDRLGVEPKNFRSIKRAKEFVATTVSHDKLQIVSFVATLHHGKFTITCKIYKWHMNQNDIWGVECEGRAGGHFRGCIKGLTEARAVAQSVVDHVLTQHQFI